VDGFSERSKIEVDLDLPADLERLSPEAETALFRIVQECLTNVHRHSQSAAARVRILRPSPGSIRLEVQDKGDGISLDKQLELTAAGTPGVGIRGMRERLRQLGGSLKINSDGQGTIVIAELPVVASTPEVAA
jgi:signal transduction histidine kinase